MQITNASDLVEDSLEILDGAERTDAEFQSAAGALYAFESNYESTATYFRSMEILERRGYFATLPLEDHPDSEEIDISEDSSVSPVLREPAEEWNEGENPVVGYAAEGTLYVEKGGELWERLCDEGVLDSEDATAPEEVSLYRAVAQIVESADAQGELDLVLRWYVVLGFHIAFHAGDEEAERELLERLQADADIGRIRAVVEGIDGLEMKLHHPERNLDPPPAALRKSHPVLKWWYALLEG